MTVQGKARHFVGGFFILEVWAPEGIAGVKGVVRAQGAKRPSLGPLDASDPRPPYDNGVRKPDRREASNGRPSPLPIGEMGGLGGTPSLCTVGAPLFFAEKGKAGFAFQGKSLR